MPAFDELRNQLDKLRQEANLTVDEAFHQLVEDYNEDAEAMEQLVYFQEELERKGYVVTWPDFRG